MGIYFSETGELRPNFEGNKGNIDGAYPLKPGGIEGHLISQSYMDEVLRSVVLPFFCENK